MNLFKNFSDSPILQFSDSPILVEQKHYKDTRYSTRNPISALLVRNFNHALQDMICETKARRVLEVGCGEGFVMDLTRRSLTPTLVVGGDYSREWLTRAATLQKDANLLTFDARRIPFRDSSFDLVLAIEVLEHVERPDIALAEIVRVTSEWAIISVPNGLIWRLTNLARGRYLGNLGNTPGHINKWSVRAFRQFAGKYFHITRHQTPIPWQIALLKKRG